MASVSMNMHTSPSHSPSWSITLIVFAQLLGTSLWFSANSAADDLIREWQLSPADLGHLTNAVQAGFIIGTLTFALSGFADRFSASRIFALSALLGALSNAIFALFANDLSGALALRFCVGLCLAGIYPLGMKMVVSWAPEKASSTLAWLVAMLTLGTALPHGIRLAGTALPWREVILVSSVLALCASLIIFRLGDGPHFQRRSGSSPLRLGQVIWAFGDRHFRASALGYFGHCWELYAFWTLTPLLITQTQLDIMLGQSVSGLSFLIIGSGAIGCILAGKLSRHFSSGRIAAVALATSGLCCALYPWLSSAPASILFGLLLLWGISVIADSAQFSAMSARACPPQLVGSALAIQNSIGFAITMVAINLGTTAITEWGVYVTWLLLPGPILGLIGLRPLWQPKTLTTSS